MLTTTLTTTPRGKKRLYRFSVQVFNDNSLIYSYQDRLGTNVRSTKQKDGVSHRSGSVLTQLIHASDPHTWANLGKGVSPTSLIGSSAWADYTVTATARLAPTASAAEYVAVTVRMGHNYEFQSIGGYKLALCGGGGGGGLLGQQQWFLNATGNATSLASGHLEQQGEGGGASVSSPKR